MWGRSSGEDSNNIGALTIIFVIIGAIVIAVIIYKVRQQGGGNEDLDYLYGRDDIERKAGKTRKLLEFLARVDQTWHRTNWKPRPKPRSQKLQECWQARNYEPMKPLMMPDLYADHCSQIERHDCQS